MGKQEVKKRKEKIGGSTSFLSPQSHYASSCKQGEDCVQGVKCFPLSSLSWPLAFFGQYKIIPGGVEGVLMAKIDCAD